MSTRGFIAIKSDGKITGTYNHSDSYPTGLGVGAIEFVQKSNLEEVAKNLGLIEQVDEDKHPTDAQLKDLKARGFWQNVSDGSDWYAALRSAQGNLAAYIDAGYIPTFDVENAIAHSDIWIEWGYVIDLDEKAIHTYEVGEEGRAMKVAHTLPFDQIMQPGFDAETVMAQVERQG